jgi:N12 class adenine-specific DNA methylase
MRTAKDDRSRTTDVLTFEELGADMLIVDEAHNYKRLKLITKMTRVAGVPSGKGSDRAFDLFIKSRYLAQAAPTGGTVFLTGTPISNTMAEMFVLMRYLAQATLDGRGIPQFDGWAATFGEKVTAFEISPTGKGFRQKTRFARFTNMPELMQMYRAFADVQTADMLKLPTPKLKGGTAQVHAIPQSTELAAYVDTLLERYEAVLGKKRREAGPARGQPAQDHRRRPQGGARPATRRRPSAGGRQTRHRQPADLRHLEA